MAVAAFEQWDTQWPSVRAEIETPGNEIRCVEKCSACCFNRKPTTLSEGLAIAHFLQSNVSEEKSEIFRIRVESATSSIAKLRETGFCDSEDSFQRAGGLECPFLDEESCAIYPVRPIECRAQYVAKNVSTDECRKCPRSVNCIESEVAKFNLCRNLGNAEREILSGQFPNYQPTGNLLPEILSMIWQSGIVQSPKWLMTESSWKSRLESRKSARDETWLDDGTDFQVINHALSLPEEGNYGVDLTLLRARTQEHEVYDRIVKNKNFPEFLTLYKRLPGTNYDWHKREFQSEMDSESNLTDDLPYTCWMSDGVQERLMMWEAAKRSYGRVLCGGLGLGVYPQLALSLPRVDSVHVVEMDHDVIEMIQNNWRIHPWSRMGKCHISQSPIEEYLMCTNEKYDVVYIDTWDAIYHEYLPHLNELTALAKRVLNPNGEILLWAFDLKVRSFLETAKDLFLKKEKFIMASEDQLHRIQVEYPLLYLLVIWLRSHPQCSGDELQDESYRLAVSQAKNQGMLKLSNQNGGHSLVNQKYFSQQGLFK